MGNHSFLLDKSVFVGTKKVELLDFVSTYTVILPETLFYECYTSPELSNRKYLNRLYQLLKAGAYVSYQLIEIIRDEGKNFCPCNCIINYFETNKHRKVPFR